MTILGYETEANNSLSAADTIRSSNPVTGQLSSTSDNDYFALDVAAAGIISLEFDSPTNSDTRNYFSVSILDSSGNVLSSERSGQDITLSAAVAESGTYYAAVSDSTWYSGENYQITFTANQNSIDGYETEANNSLSTADTISSSSSVTGQLSSTSDNDYFALDVAAAGIISLEFDSPTNSDTRNYFSVSILDSSGNVLSSERSGQDITLSAAVAESGTYYAAVSDSTWYSGENYQITFTANQNSIDGYETEANNSLSTADTIRSSNPVTGQLSSTLDNDYFALDVAAAGIISLEFDSPTNSDTRNYFSVSILDSSGNVLSSERSGQDITLSAAVAESGTYYAAVSDSTWYSGENYQITFTANQNSIDGYETEANNSLSTADTIRSSNPVTGQLSSTLDNDYFALDVAAAGIISLEFDSPTNSDTRNYFSVSILDSSGNVLSSERSGQDITLSAAVAESGTYYAAVSDSTWYSGENYQITFTANQNSIDGYETEANNSLSTADTIRSSNPVTGQLSSTSDNDYFALDVAAAGIISLEFDSPTNSDTRNYFSVSILDSSGNVLSSERSGQDITLSAAVAESGTYYAAVSDSTWYSGENYQILVGYPSHTSVAAETVPLLDYFLSSNIPVGAGNIPIDFIYVAEFSEKLKLGTGSFRLTDTSGNTIATISSDSDRISLDGKVLTINLGGLLDYDQEILSIVSTDFLRLEDGTILDEYTSSESVATSLEPNEYSQLYFDTDFIFPISNDLTNLSLTEALLSGFAEPTAFAAYQSSIDEVDQSNVTTTETSTNLGHHYTKNELILENSPFFYDTVSFVGADATDEGLTTSQTDTGYYLIKSITYKKNGNVIASFEPSTPIIVSDDLTGVNLNELFWSGADHITAPDQDNIIFGYGGNDFIKGGDSSDQISGGAGDDTLWGYNGSDLIYGEDGDDYLWAAGGNDKIYGGSGQDTLFLHGETTDYLFKNEIDQNGKSYTQITDLVSREIDHAYDVELFAFYNENGTQQILTVSDLNAEITNIINVILPDEIDLSSGDTWTTFIASSDLELEKVLFRFDRDIISGTSSNDFLGFWGYSDEWDDGRSGRIVDISGNNELGAVTLEKVEIYETDGTKTTLNTTDLEALGLDTSFDFVDGNSQSGTSTTSSFDPTKLDYTFPSIVNISENGGEFEILASAFDASGIENVVFNLGSEINYGSSYSFFGLWGIGDDWDDGSSSNTFDLSSSNSGGFVEIQSVDVKTSDGIEYVYYQHDLKSLGLQTSFEIQSVIDAYLSDDVTEPNDSFATAFDVNIKSGLGLDAAFVDISGLRISSVSDNDYYKFNVSSDETYELIASFSHSEGDLDIALYDDELNFLEESASASDNESLFISSAGTYYLHVFGYDGAEANYSLRATLGDTTEGGIPEDQYEDNDTFASAYGAGIVTSSQNFVVSDLTIDQPDDDDYYRFELQQDANITFSVNFDHSEGDIDVELYDSKENLIDDSTTASNQEFIDLEDLAAGEYVLRVYGYDGAVTSSYSVETSVTLQTSTHTVDAYEKNEKLSDAHDLGAISSENVNTNIVESATIHSATDQDYYKFTIDGTQSYGIEVAFSNSDGDLDIDLLDDKGYWIDGSDSADDNEYISLAGLAAGTYVLHAFGYDGATVEDYSIVFKEEGSSDAQLTLDAFEDNNTSDKAYNLGTIDTESAITALPDLTSLNIDKASDEDWFKFTYDETTRLDVSITFDGDAADLDLELYKEGEIWLDGSYGTEGTEEISLIGLSSGTYYVRIAEYYGSTLENYSLNFTLQETESVADLYDVYEPNNSFGTAHSMGQATGEGRINDLTLTTGDEDWYSAYFVNNGTSDQYIRAIFDHQDGDIDIELYDSNETLIRSATSVTDNETIYLSDIAGDAQYYLRVLSYGGTDYQEYSIEYAFPIEATEISITADTYDTSAAGNQSYDIATTVGLVSTTNNLNLHTTTDHDWFAFDTRNRSASDATISIEYDEAFGAVDLSLWAIDVGDSTPSLVARSSTGNGREVLPFGDYAAGQYYLEVNASDAELIPNYSLTLNVTEIEGSTAQSSVIPSDAFDRLSSNDTAETATDLGKLANAYTAENLSIHSEVDKDYFTFEVAYDGEAVIDLNFTHDLGDIDTILRDGAGVTVASGESGDDNEQISFQASAGETYSLEVFGYSGATIRDYDLVITPKQLNARRDDYESNDSLSQATTVRDARAAYDGLTLHNASDQDWFAFTIAEIAGSSNKVQVTNLLGKNLDLKIYQNDGQTIVDSLLISDTDGSIDTSGYAAGTYYAAISSTASNDAAPAEQLSNYNLYIDQVAGVAPSTNATWTIMVYIDGDNNLASAAVDDLNEMEGVILPENVNVVTLTDLSAEYSTTAGWSDTRLGEISPDPNGYTYAGRALTSELTSVGEKNMGDASTLTDFINWSTTNHAADNYGLILWDHGGGLFGIAWDDTNNHDNLSMSEIKTAIDNSAAFSSENKLDLIGFDACLMQSYEIGFELAPIADVMVASQETEPGDGWDYESFLSSLAQNPYASAKTLGGYIVDSYDAWYNSNSETLSAVDLSKYQAIDDAIAAFNAIALGASGSEWLKIDDAVENAWSSASLSYGWAGEERDIGQLFKYISENVTTESLKTAATGVITAIDDAVSSNSSRQDLSGIQAAVLATNSALWAGNGLIGKSGSAWGTFQTLYATADRTVRSATAVNLTPDQTETRDALGRISQGNNTSVNAYDIGIVTNATHIDDLTIHNETDVDWYKFKTPTNLAETGNIIKLLASGTASLTASLYDANRELISQKADLDINFDVAEDTQYLLKVVSTAGRQDIAYSLDVDLVAADNTQDIIVADLAEGSSSNNSRSKATELSFTKDADSALSNLNLSLTNSDQDWFEIKSGRISEQSPNRFSVIVTDQDIADDEDIIIEIADATGAILVTSTGIGQHETIIYEDYTSDIFINVKSATGKILDYKLNLAHADYDVDGNGTFSASLDGQAILASLFADADTYEVADNTIGLDAQEALANYMTRNKSTLLDVDGDGVVKALTDGVILNAYMNGASLEDVFQFRSLNSPLETYEDLQSHLLEILI